MRSLWNKLATSGHISTNSIKMHPNRLEGRQMEMSVKTNYTLRFSNRILTFLKCVFFKNKLKTLINYCTIV